MYKGPEQSSLGTTVMLALASICTMAFLLSAIAAGDGEETTSEQQPAIIVGPNMLVSRDGDFPHMELSLAVNPQNPKNLVGAAITATRGEGGFACKTYASFDGGNSWVDSSFPEQLEWGGADPQVAFGSHGTAYFTSLAFVKDEKGDTRGGLFFYRSEDGGRTWQKPVNLGYSYDHEVLVVDHSFGKYAGRIYLSVLYGPYPEYIVGVFRSDDDGRSFTGPVDAVSGQRIIGINTAANILLLRDGTLIVPYLDFEYDPEKAKKSHSRNMWLVSSPDGGVTFSQPLKVDTQELNPDQKGPGFETFYAAAADSSAAFPDRVYTAWTDYRSGAYRVLFSYSTDRGKSWNSPKQVDPKGPPWVSQYQPMIAVNKDGVVGLSWFDTRNSENPDNKQYDEYFATSMDGGESFSGSTRVSSKTSSPFGKRNVTMQADSWRYKDEVRVSFLSAVSRWPAGGDYMGLGSDSEGLFHPFWADARTGTFQIQTAAITVPKMEPRAGKATRGTASVDEAAGSKPVAASSKVSTSLLGRVELVFDPTSYDPLTGVLEVPTRLRNISSTPIYAPITLEVTKFGSGLGDEWKEFAPKILNADNGKDKAGARFDYSATLGTSQLLAANGLSGEIVWRIKVEDPLKVPDFHVALTGLVSEIK